MDGAVQVCPEFATHSPTDFGSGRQFFFNVIKRNIYLMKING
jgi:hypothetical protein